MDEREIINENIFKIISSKSFRQLKDKTQLFSAGNDECFRNRLTHSLEVKNIAFEIARGLSQEFERINYNCNYDLIEAIALAHDIGHTPFGHVGERTLQDILAREDCLGGMLCKDNEKLFFKHNVNSIRILARKISSIHWKILDGVVKHTSVNHTNDKYKKINSGIALIFKNITDGNYSLNSNFNKYIKDNVDNKLGKKYDKIKFSLTIEGQIIAIADEIAQRIADFDDTYRSRYAFQLIKDLDDIKVTTKEMDFGDVVLSIKKALIKKLCKEINNKKQIENYSRKCVICFDGIKRFDDKKNNKMKFTDKDKTKGNYINYQLLKFIKEVVTKSEYVREMDAKASFIIRQLFKAYFNNFEQLPDNVLREIIDDVSDFLRANYSQKYIKQIICKLGLDLTKSKNRKKDLKDIFYLNQYNVKKERLINVSKLSVVMEIMKDICSKGSENKDIIKKEIKNSYKFGNIFMNNIAYHISEMTDSYAIHEFEKLYLQKH